MIRPYQPLAWTEEMDSRLRELWPRMSGAKIAKIFDLPVERVRRRVRALGLPSHRVVRYGKKSGQPARNVLEQAYRDQAGPAAPFKDIALGERHQAACIARWRAFQIVLCTVPGVTIAGVARVAGYDHTTILHGLNRLRELEAA